MKNARIFCLRGKLRRSQVGGAAMAKLLRLAAQKLIMPEFEGAATFSKNATAFKESLEKAIDAVQQALE